MSRFKFYDTDISSTTECFKTPSVPDFSKKGSKTLAFDYDTRKPEKKVEKISALGHNNELKIVQSIISQIEKTPKLVKYLNISNVRGFLKRCEEAMLGESKVKCNLIKAFRASEKKRGDLYRLLSFLYSGVLQVGNLDNHRFVASRGVIVRKNRILLVNASQRKSREFKKVGVYSGLYKGKPAIVKFCVQALNEVSELMELPSGVRGMSGIIKTYELKKPKLVIPASNILKDDKSFVMTLSDEDLAQEFEDGNIDRETLKEQLSAKRVNNINRILKSKVELV